MAAGRKRTFLIPVLAYQRIRDGSSPVIPGSRALGRKEFQAQLQRLDRWGMTTVTFRDIRLAADGQITLPLRPVVLTFDGGFAETFTVVYPALQESGMTGVVFVTGQSAGSLNGAKTGSGLMEKNQILELHEAGFEIGSYSLTGRSLTAMPATEAWDEISQSRMNLEILINSGVHTFAYPGGNCSDPVKKMVRDAGYQHACLLTEFPRPRRNDPLGILRADATGLANPLRFAWTVRGWTLRHGFEFHDDQT